LTPAQRLTGGGRFALHPRVAVDGLIAYVEESGNEPPVTRILDPATGRISTLARRNQFGFELGPAGWLPDGSIITAQFEYRDNYRAFQDLYRISPNGRERRLTSAARLAEPDPAPDGRHIVAVQSHGQGNSLVTYDLVSGQITTLSPARRDVLWSMPRWSPDGRFIASARWRLGGQFEIVVLDALGTLVQYLVRDSAIVSAPAWAPDGRHILFWSDRNGIPNLFAASFDPDAGPGAQAVSTAIRQVTNVLTGAFYPEVSPDGDWIYFTGYGAEGFFIERLPFEPARWREPMPRRLPRASMLADAAEVPQRPFAAGMPARAGTRTDGDAVPAPSISASRPYSALTTLLPRFWMPVAIDEGGWFIGALTAGEDLVGRHSYGLWGAVHPVRSRLQGEVDYFYAGLGSPILGFGASRSWELVGRQNLPDGSGIASTMLREDVLSLSATVPRRRWRSGTGLRVGVEHISGLYQLDDAPGFRLQGDTTYRMVGITTSASYGNSRSYATSISREDGIALAATARQRWDLDTSTDDSGYSELIGAASAYTGVRTGGRSNHVLAARFSALWRDGAGARATRIGGVSGTPQNIIIGQSLGGSPLLLPIRGFEYGVRSGTRAWTSSVEYRFPIAKVDRGYRTLPFFFERVVGSAFADLGQAWCATGQCGYDDPRDRPLLLGAGAELGIDFGLFFGAPFRSRLGAAVPLRGPGDQPRFYFQFGQSF
jgi:hypothetical protein